MPARFRDIKKEANRRGIACEKPRSGSHWKFRTDDQSYTIPSSNGMKTEIGDNYIRGFCRAFGLDLEDFKSGL